MSTTDDNHNPLTDDERATFERLAEHYDNEVGEIFETALQSSSDNEEASS
jgi:hypothetical protein